MQKLTIGNIAALIIGFIAAYVLAIMIMTGG